MDKYTEIEKQAQKFLDETDTMQFSTVELLTMFYNHQEQLRIGGVSNRTFNTLESIDADTKEMINRVSQDGYVMTKQDNEEMKMRIDALKSVLYGC